MKKMIKPIKTVILVFAAVFFIAAIFCGCSAKGGNNPSPSPTLAPDKTQQQEVNPSSAPSPSVDLQEPVISPSAESTPYSANPVYSFYSEYYSASHTPLEAISNKLAGVKSAEALEFSLMCDAHSRALSVLNQSIGRLTYTDASTYSATLSGSEAGSGTLSSSDSGYSFEFTYDDDTALRGTYYQTEQTEKIEFTIASPTMGQTRCSIQKSEQGWTSVVSELESITILSVSGDETASFAFDLRQAVLSGSNVYLCDYTPPVEEEPDAATFATP